MRDCRATWRAVLVLAWCIAAPAAAWASQRDPFPEGRLPRADVSAGVTIQAPTDVNLPPYCDRLALPCGTPRTFGDIGLAMSVAGYLNEAVAVAGEANLFDNIWYSSLTKQGKEDNVVRSLLGGVRVSVVPPAVGGRKAKGVQLFGQVLAGTVWSSVMSPRRAIQPGVGIDARMPSGRPVVRIQLDYSFVPGEGRNLSGTRVLVGMVCGFGSRDPLGN